LLKKMPWTCVLVMVLMTLSLPVHAASMAKIMSLPIYVGEGKDRVKIRIGDVFKDMLDVALNAGAYGLKGDPIGLTSVLTNLPTEFQGVLLAKIEMERHYAYRQLMKAHDTGNPHDKAYFGRMVERLEAAKTWVASGDGRDLSRHIAKLRKKKEAPEEEPTTTVSSGTLRSTGYFKSKVPGISYSENRLSFDIYLNEHGIPHIRGQGRVVIELGGDKARFYFKINRGELISRDPDKTYLDLSDIPKTTAWEIYGRIHMEINGEPAPVDGSIQGKAFMKGDDSIRGEIFGMRGFLRRASQFDTIRGLLPGTMDFETHHYF